MTSAEQPRPAEVGDRVHSGDLGGTVHRIDEFFVPELRIQVRTGIYVLWDSPGEAVDA